MSNSQRHLCLDLGAGSVKAAEFEINSTGGLILKRYRARPLGLEGSQDSKRDKSIQAAISDLLTYRGFTARRTNMCAPGYQVFSKFIKLPPVDNTKARQIIQYEAQQNIPYPMDEAVWDFQIMGAAPTGEVEVLLVAMKATAVESLFQTADKTGLRPEIVDASPAALCNAFRFNYGDPEECVMLLDIGAKTSNVLLFEKGKVFFRSINIGANAITQDFVAEAKLPFAKAEELKVNEGFVGLGGAYEEPESLHAAAVSKIARQVFTRLHIQVNQTIQFYRGQLGGSAPIRIYLAGGGSTMPHTSDFFTDKFNVPVEFFNPFRNVAIDPDLNIPELSKVAHTFGEVVGLALRNVAQCPIELNLVPKSIRDKQLFRQKTPYFLATFASLVLVVFAIGLFFNHTTAIKKQSLADLNIEYKPLQHRAEELEKQEHLLNAAYNEANLLTAQVKDRFFWPEALIEMRGLLMNVEDRMARTGNKVGVWIENFGTVDPGEFDAEAEATPAPIVPFGSIEWMKQNPEMAERYFRELYRALVEKGIIKPGERTLKSVPTANTNLFTINVKFRAVTPISPNDPAANGRLAYAVADEFKNSAYFDPEGTRLSSDMEEAEPLTPVANTFRFDMVLKLKSELQM